MELCRAQNTNSASKPESHLRVASSKFSTKSFSQAADQRQGPPNDNGRNVYAEAYKYGRG
jgi:hypothetical protein